MIEGVLEPDPDDAGLGLLGWFTKYSAPAYRAKHTARLRLNHMPEPTFSGEIVRIRKVAVEQVARSTWGRMTIAIHEKWWPVGIKGWRFELVERDHMPFFTATEALAYRDPRGEAAMFAELELEAITVPMQPQMGHAGKLDG